MDVTGDETVGRLSALRVHDIRSVWGRAVELPLGPAATFLVGPNRAGTSNLAWAVAAALDPEVRFRPGRDLPRRVPDPHPWVAGDVEGREAWTVRWNRHSGAHDASRPGGHVVRAAADDTPRDVVRRSGLARVEDERRLLERILLTLARRVLPEIAEATVDGTLAVQVRDDLGSTLPLPEVRALASLAVAHALTALGRPPMATIVEAPEALLHPAAQESVGRLLVETAAETGAPLLATTVSPFVIPRIAAVEVVAVARDAAGATQVVGHARGHEDQAGMLGGLFRDSGLAETLDRIGRIPADTRAVLVVEGGTDEAYLGLAAELLGRASDLDGLVIRPAGGAMPAALAAVILRAELAVPVLVLLDHDDPGRRARDTLVDRFGFSRATEVVTYADVFEGGPVGVEAETLFDVRLVRRFVHVRGHGSSHGEHVLPGGVVSVDLTSSGKSAFIDWVRTNARPEHLIGWDRLLDRLHALLP
jgi:5S rRNA maturation endonuclease (ribonuclease M5)